MRHLLIGMACLLGLTAKAAADDSQGPILKRFVDEFVRLTPGQGTYPAKFTMGSAEADAPATEKPARTVAMNYPFAIAKYEVTQELYEAVVGANPSRWKGPRNSVEKVSWEEANTFCKRVTKELQERKLLGPDEIIRLPTEAEWEYACRAGTTSAYSFENPEDLKKYGWFRGNSPGEDPPVGRLQANPWGLYDLHGYVWEWCLDTWHPSYDGAPPDARAWVDATAKERVLRGGSWADPADRARSAFRHHQPAGHLSDAIGFRCVRVQDKGAGQ